MSGSRPLWALHYLGRYRHVTPSLTPRPPLVRTRRETYRGLTVQTQSVLGHDSPHDIELKYPRSADQFSNPSSVLLLTRQSESQISEKC